MRELADSTRIERFMRELGRAVDVEGRVYLTGGATAVLHGWRDTTIAAGLVNPTEALIQFKAIESELYRFPAIDPASFRKAVDDLFTA
jgi:hypothetical protein